MIDVIDWPAPFTTVQEEWEGRIRSGPVVGMVVPGSNGRPRSFTVQAVYDGGCVIAKALNPDYYIPPIPVSEWRDLMIRYARARGEWYDTEEEPEEWG